MATELSPDWIAQVLAWVKERQEPEESFTSEEYREVRMIGRRNAKLELQIMLAKGMIESVKVARLDMHGRLQHLYAWRWTDAAKELVASREGAKDTGVL